MSYSIIIPIFNEEKTLKTLIKQLKEYHLQGDEIIIVNDGSTDNTTLLLKSCNYIKSIHLKNNFGKGVAIKTGLLFSKNSKIIIFDSDLELNTIEIKKLMYLDRDSGITSIVGFRFQSLNPFKSGIDWGNFMFTSFFNLLFQSCHKDILCCAKAFYKDDLPIKKLNSKGFDIDVEILSFLTKNSRRAKIPQILLKYKRRSFNEGKKLKISHGWKILIRIIKSL